MRKLYYLGVVIVLGVGCSFMQQEASPTPTITSMVESTIAVTPSPKYLGVILPGPGEVYSIAEYNALSSSLGWEATTPGVCFGLYPFWLLEPGDFPTTQEWLERIHLVVDGKIITEYHSILMTDSLGSEGLDPETGQVLFREPAGSPFRICYASLLEVGQHTATFVAKKTSGAEVTYTWQFRITE